MPASKKPLKGGKIVMQTCHIVEQGSEAWVMHRFRDPALEPQIHSLKKGDSIVFGSVSSVELTTGGAFGESLQVIDAVTGEPSDFSRTHGVWRIIARVTCDIRVHFHQPVKKSHADYHEPCSYSVA